MERLEGAPIVPRNAQYGGPQPCADAATTKATHEIAAAREIQPGKSDAGRSGSASDTPKGCRAAANASQRGASAEKRKKRRATQGGRTSDRKRLTKRKAARG